MLNTDWSRPGASITASVADGRALHYWDVHRRVSAMYGGPGNVGKLAAKSTIGFRMQDVIWDAALLYPPGVKWGGIARLLVAPVFKYADGMF